jgi:hypothetical protein
MFRSRKRADLDIAESAPGLEPALLAMREQGLEVLPVRGNGMAADLPFGAQMPQEPIDPVVRGGILRQ